MRKLFPDIWLIGTFHEREDRRTDASGDPLLALPGAGWGDYVALRRARDGSQLDILVSPSAAIPCYVCQTASRLVLGSDAGQVLREAGHPVAIDWDALLFQLHFREARSCRTALRGLTEIPAGALGSIREGGISLAPAWQPDSFARRSSGADIEQNASRLRQSVQKVIGTMKSEWRRALIGISGGVDSSILALSCMTAGVEFDCFTMFEPDSDGDERRYARSLAARLGKSLIECPYSIDDVDVTRSSVATLPRPIGWQFQQSLDRNCNAVADRLGADVVLRGTGGDAIFYASHTVAPIIDALRDNGMIAGARTLVDISRLHGCSLATALRLVMRRLVRPTDGARCADVDLLAAGAKSAASLSPGRDVQHAGLAPGRREHIRMIASMRNFVEARLVLSTRASCPLFSQPVIETALSIPSRHWVHHGVDRAVARMAFSDLLPGEILRRRSKGTADGFAARFFEARRGALQELLQDGLLVANHIIDPIALGEVIATGGNLAPLRIQRLLALADAEAWARHWSSRS